MPAISRCLNLCVEINCGGGSAGSLGFSRLSPGSPSLAGLFVGWWARRRLFRQRIFLSRADHRADFAAEAAKRDRKRRNNGVAASWKVSLRPVGRTILSMMPHRVHNDFRFPNDLVMLPLYVRNILRLGPRELGWLMAVSGTGAFSGSLGLLTIARD